MFTGFTLMSRSERVELEGKHGKEGAMKYMENVGGGPGHFAYMQKKWNALTEEEKDEWNKKAKTQNGAAATEI